MLRIYDSRHSTQHLIQVIAVMTCGSEVLFRVLLHGYFLIWLVRRLVDSVDILVNDPYPNAEEHAASFGSATIK